MGERQGGGEKNNGKENGNHNASSLFLAGAAARQQLGLGRRAASTGDCTSAIGETPPPTARTTRTKRERNEAETKRIVVVDVIKRAEKNI